MNMRKILTLLFVLVALAGQAKEKTIVWEQPADSMPNRHRPRNHSKSKVN